MIKCVCGTEMGKGLYNLSVGDLRWRMQRFAGIREKIPDKSFNYSAVFIEEE
jgi:hypothetical protein